MYSKSQSTSQSPSASLKIRSAASQASTSQQRDVVSQTEVQLLNARLSRREKTIGELKRQVDRLESELKERDAVDDELQLSDEEDVRQKMRYQGHYAYLDEDKLWKCGDCGWEVIDLRREDVVANEANAECCKCARKYLVPLQAFDDEYHDFRELSDTNPDEDDDEDGSEDEDGVTTMREIALERYCHLPVLGELPSHIGRPDDQGEVYSAEDSDSESENESDTDPDAASDSETIEEPEPEDQNDEAEEQEEYTDGEDDRAPAEREPNDSDIRLVKLGATLSMIDFFSLRWSDQHGLVGTVTGPLSEEPLPACMTHGKKWEFHCGLLDDGAIVLNESDYDGKEFVAVFLDVNRLNTCVEGEGFVTVTPELRKSMSPAQKWLTDDDFEDNGSIYSMSFGSGDSSPASWNEDMTAAELWGDEMEVGAVDEEMADANAVDAPAAASVEVQDNPQTLQSSVEGEQS